MQYVNKRVQKQTPSPVVHQSGMIFPWTLGPFVVFVRGFAVQYFLNSKDTYIQDEVKVNYADQHRKNKHQDAQIHLYFYSEPTLTR